MVPALTPLFPSAEVARALRNVVCVGPKAARRRLSRAEPGLHDRHLDAADRRIGRRGFSGPGQLPVRAGGIAIERGFVQRAEAIGLRYNVATRIEGYNYSQGRAISIAIFRSEGTE